MPRQQRNNFLSFLATDPEWSAVFATTPCDRCSEKKIECRVYTTGTATTCCTYCLPHGEKAWELCNATYAPLSHADMYFSPFSPITPIIPDSSLYGTLSIPQLSQTLSAYRTWLGITSAKLLSSHEGYKILEEFRKLELRAESDSLILQRTLPRLSRALNLPRRRAANTAKATVYEHYKAVGVRVLDRIKKKGEERMEILNKINRMLERKDQVTGKRKRDAESANLGQETRSGDDREWLRTLEMYARAMESNVIEERNRLVRMAGGTSTNMVADGAPGSA